MAKSVHDNWYQRRSILGDRRHVGDRDIPNLHSDGVLESKNSSCRGQSIAGVQQCQKSAILKSLNRMEELVSQIINIIDKQSQNMRELSRQYNTDLEQIRNKYLEKKKATDASWETAIQKMPKQDSKAAHNEKHVVDLGGYDKVVEQEEEHEDSIATEVAKCEYWSKLLPIQSTFLKILREESTNFRSETFDGYDFKHGDCMSAGNSREEVYRSARMLIIKSQEAVSLEFRKKKHKRWRVIVRRQKKPRKDTVPTGFLMAQKILGGRRGEDSPTQGQMWWWRKLCNHEGEETLALVIQNKG